MFSKLPSFKLSKLSKIWKWANSDLEAFVHFQILERRNLDFQTFQLFLEVYNAPKVPMFSEGWTWPGFFHHLDFSWFE